MLSFPGPVRSLEATFWMSLSCLIINHQSSVWSNQDETEEHYSSVTDLHQKNFHHYLMYCRIQGISTFFSNSLFDLKKKKWTKTTKHMSLSRYLQISLYCLLLFIIVNIWMFHNAILFSKNHICQTFVAILDRMSWVTAWPTESGAALRFGLRSSNQPSLAGKCGKTHYN